MGGQGGTKGVDQTDTADQHRPPSDPGGKRQRPAYTDCLTTRGKAHTWVGFIDIDEFLVLKRHACVNDFLAEHLKQVLYSTLQHSTLRVQHSLAAYVYRIRAYENLLRS